MPVCTYKQPKEIQKIEEMKKQNQQKTEVLLCCIIAKSFYLLTHVNLCCIQKLMLNIDLWSADVNSYIYYVIMTSRITTFLRNDTHVHVSSTETAHWGKCETVQMCQTAKVRTHIGKDRFYFHGFPMLPYWFLFKLYYVHRCSLPNMLIVVRFVEQYPF